MAVIRPFRGIRYNLSRIGDLSTVITQPYDRIHGAEQARYYELSPYNFVRIILGKRTPTTPRRITSTPRPLLRPDLAGGGDSGAGRAPLALRPGTIVHHARRPEPHPSGTGGGPSTDPL